MQQSSPFRDQFEQALKERLFVSENLVHHDLEPALARIATLPLNPTEAPSDQTGSEAQSEDFDAARTRRHLVKTAAGNFWISGNSILTECPDCHAPMTIRGWLRLADCWRCSTSVQLSKKQMESIEELARQQNELLPGETPTGPDRPARRQCAADSKEIALPIIEAEPALDPNLDELNRLTKQSLAANIVRRGFSAIPAWLLSFLLHLILILLLALFVFTNVSVPPTITLSSFISPDRKEGGEIRIENPENTLVDDLMMANDLDVDMEEMREVIQKAQTDASELIAEDSPMSNLPDLDEVKKNVTTDRDQLMSFAARDPRVRTEIVKKEGGTSLTEAAVARGLRWLATVQNDDGSWSLSNFDRSHKRGNKGDAAGTSLALLPFLGAGQTHEFGIYRETVALGLAWLIKHQKDTGDLRINFPGQAGMYAHGQATIVLCEALAMTGDERFRAPAQKAIRFIESAQDEAGGWRYRPGQSGDTSVLGWQLMALQSARAGDLGIEIDDSSFKLADYFLDQAVYRRQHRSGNMKNLPTGSLYTYLPGQGKATASMTAEAILCRMYLGWTREDPRLIEAVRWLIEHNFPTTRDKNVYYWYYATQVVHHFGGQVWNVWNRKMREILVAGQEKSGSRAGSWDPRGYEWGAQGGRIYVTSLSICTLEVYYRHLPIFKKIDLDDRSPVSTRLSNR